ncbi:hypothetical protein V5F90_18755 [Priestia aryabhattai]
MINKQSKIFVTITFAVYIFMPLATFNVVQLDFYSNIDTIIFDFIFILVIVFISQYSASKLVFHRIIIAIAIGNGMYIIPQIILNLPDLLSISNYTWIVDGERTSRATYGMRHANFTGTTLLIQLLSLFFLLANIKGRFRQAVLLIIELVLFMALLTTGNRAAVYGIGISTIFVSCLFILKLFSVNIRKLIIFYFLILVVAFMTFVFDWNNFYNSSASLIERYTIMKSVFKEINEYGDYFFGIAPIDQISLAGKYLFLRNDNSFVQTIVLYGFIGLILMLILIIYLLFKEINIYFQENSKQSMFKLIVFATAISYSTMEITLFAHGYPLSLFFWIVILYNFRSETGVKH